MATAFDAHERSRWSGRARAYARSFARLCAHPAAALLDAANVHPGSHVADVGTGPGTVAALAVDRGATVTAIDADPGMLALTAARVPAARTHLAILPDLPFADGEFDATIANFVINHVGEPRRAVAELARVTRPGGRVAVTVWPLPAPPAQALWAQIFRTAAVDIPAELPELPQDQDFSRTPEGLAHLLRTAALDVVRVDELAWHLEIDPEDWWAGPAAGIATPGLILTRQPPAAVTRIRAAFDELTAPYRTPSGTLSLPTSALLAAAARRG